MKPLAALPSSDKGVRQMKVINLIFRFTSIILILGFVVTLEAGTTGKIAGVIKDQSTGEPLAGVNVQLVGTVLGAATDLDGSYIILQIPPGKYTLEVSYIGYRTQNVENIAVSIDLTTKVNVELQSETMELDEVVMVVAEREMITKDMTASQSVVGDEEIQALPVQELEDVLVIQAGVTQGRDGSIHIRGGRTEEISYMVDGVQVSDGFSGEIAVEVENNSVQELQVISGTFNAEYGRALSGIINIVTKDGGDELKGTVTAWVGDYYSTDTDVYPKIDDFDPTGTFNGQFSLEGPIPFTNKNLTFFLTGRYYKDDSYINATRLFNPSDSSSFSADNPDDWYIEQTGDGATVPFMRTEKYSLLGKLSYRFSSQFRLASSVMYSDLVTRDWSAEGSEFTPENQFHDYYHFMLNPDGSAQQYRTGFTWINTIDHALSASTFYTLVFTALQSDEQSYVYEDRFDPRYLPETRLQNISYGNAFYTGGVDPWHTERSTRSYIGKFDITSQVSNQHQFKSGLEYRYHDLSYEEVKIIPAKDENGIEIRPFQPALPPRISPFNNAYTHNPQDFTFYIQDKMEFDFMVVNVGVRYDLFNPNAKVPTDPSDPANPDKLKDAELKDQLSPRLGVAIPYSETGVLHFSYGLFFQMPLYQYLYANSEFEVEIGRLKTLMGNADLQPQKTIVYEIGFQQQLSRSLAIDFTAFYKDMRNLLGTEIEELTVGADRYARYINRDFGNARGFTIALNQRTSEVFSASVDYTFQIAEGNASEPNAAFIDQQANRESEKRLVPLDWDQRHTLNASLVWVPIQPLSFSFLIRYGSGMPYTPEFLNVRKAFENTSRSKSTSSIDLKTQYVLGLGFTDLLIFLQIQNLLDNRNEVIVYNDTGRAGYTISSRLTGTIRGVNSLDDFFSNPVYHFAPPRQILLGITASF